MIFHRSPECLRAQAVKDLRKVEQQLIKQTCSDTLRMIIAQNIKDLATRK